MDDIEAVSQPDDPTLMGHPSQAEGEDADHEDVHDDPRRDGHPSQAEGDDLDRD